MVEITRRKDGQMGKTTPTRPEIKILDRPTTHFQNTWQKQWEQYRQKVLPDRRTLAQQDRDLQHRWKFHGGASKGESSLMVQIRRENIGLILTLGFLAMISSFIH